MDHEIQYALEKEEKRNEGGNHMKISVSEAWGGKGTDLDSKARREYGRNKVAGSGEGGMHRCGLRCEVGHPLAKQ